MMTVKKPYIIQLLIPTQCHGMEFKYTALVQAGDKRSAVKKFIFHINAELRKLNSRIDPEIKLHHPNNIEDEKTRLSIYDDEDNSFRIIIKELSRHSDFINITNIFS